MRTRWGRRPQYPHKFCGYSDGIPNKKGPEGAFNTVDRSEITLVQSQLPRGLVNQQ